ncbi:MAG: hypothetical protein J6X49_18245 [Victivallales bacterium]|nr:hypothetical protein [Victivallales bacterium]
MAHSVRPIAQSAIFIGYCKREYNAAPYGVAVVQSATALPRNVKDYLFFARME